MKTALFCNRCKSFFEDREIVYQLREAGGDIAYYHRTCRPKHSTLVSRAKASTFQLPLERPPRKGYRTKRKETRRGNHDDKEGMEKLSDHS